MYIIAGVTDHRPAIESALSISVRYHDYQNKQTYRGGSYTRNHIIPVWRKVRESRPPLYVEVAAILHDIAEDTEYSVDLVRRDFGAEVADLVWRLTDEPGGNRALRKARTYPKIKANKWAVLIKLADRYINTKGSEKKEMYQREFDSFKKNLYTPGVWNAQWKELERVTQ